MGKARRFLAVLAAIVIGVASMPHGFSTQAAEQKERYVVYGREQSIRTVKDIPRVKQAKRIFKGRLNRQEVRELREEGAIVEKDIELDGCSESQISEPEEQDTTMED